MVHGVAELVVVLSQPPAIPASVESRIRSLALTASPLFSLWLVAGTSVSGALTLVPPQVPALRAWMTSTSSPVSGCPEPTSQLKLITLVLQAARPM